MKEQNHQGKHLKRIVYRKENLKWVTPHVLRHTFASTLVQNNISLYKVSQWLGHSDISTTQIYAHLKPIDEDITAIEYKKE